MAGSELKKLIEERLSAPVPCFGHCKEQAKLKFIREEGGELIACHVCPSGYVSRIIAYGRGAEPNFRSFVSGLLGYDQDVRDEDFRVATRYGWDMGVEGGDEPIIMKETYWTQNYRRTKSDDPDRPLIFLCSECGSPFLQPVRGAKSQCNKCRAQST